MKKFSIVGFAAFIAFILSPEVLAVGLNWSVGEMSTNAPKNLPTTSTGGGPVAGVAGFLRNLSNGLTYLAAAVGILFLVVNAFLMSTSFGGSDQLSKAKTGMIWVMAGLILVIFSFKITEQVIKVIYATQ